MLRPLITLSFVMAIPAGLAAQEKPTPAVQQAITGSWQFDQSHSDTVAGNPLAGANASRAISGGAADAGHSGGGSGGGGGGGGKSGGKGGSAAPATAPITTPPATDAAAAPPPAAGRNRDPHLQIVLEDADPGAGIAIAANDSVVSMATAPQLKAGTQAAWRTDGKKHQDAQMDGSIIEKQAMWRDGVLTTIITVAGVGSLKREFKLSKDGRTLEIKESIEAGPRKADKKLVFTRTK